MSTVPVSPEVDDHRPPEPAQPATSLVQGTQLVKSYVKTFPTCGETVIVVGGGCSNENREAVPKGLGEDPEGSAERSARRRRSMVRRYLIHNRLHRLWTLTYADAVWDYARVKRDIGSLVRRIRADRKSLGRGESFPYLWVIERHPGGHGLHVHIAMRGFIRKSHLQAMWRQGIVQFSDRRKHAAEHFKGAELAAYFAKELSSYLTKEQAEVPEKHFYDRAQGEEFTPPEEAEWVSGDMASIIGHVAATHFDGEAPHRRWSSDELGEKWEGPPVLLLYWYG